MRIDRPLQRSTVHLRPVLGLLLLATLACGKKGEQSEATRQEGATTIQAAPDDIAPERAAVSDTTPGVPAAPSPGKPPVSNSRPGGAIIGYDSAFGPSYELDSAGRPIPIKKRKP